MSWPGALFTYQFFQSFVDARGNPFPICGTELAAVDWFENSRQAMHLALDYASNPGPFPNYGADSWGISSAEGPDEAYHAYGAPPLARTDPPEEDGTVTYYGMLSSLGFAKDPNGIGDGALYAAVLNALRAGWDRGHWHYRFGLPHAHNSDIRESVARCRLCPEWLRTEGAWLQRPTFAIDQSPATAPGKCPLGADLEPVGRKPQYPARDQPAAGARTGETTVGSRRLCGGGFVNGARQRLGGHDGLSASGR